MIPKNIIFFWDSNNVPDDVIENINQFRIRYPLHTVTLYNDNDIIHLFSDEYPDIINLYKKITIYAAKSDLARIMLLIKYGGIFLDTCSSPDAFIKTPNTITSLEDIYTNNNFDVYLDRGENESGNYNISLGCIISIPECKLLKDYLNKIYNNLNEHYIKEQSTQDYIPYNIYVMLGIVEIIKLLDYTFDNNYRKDKLNLYSDLNESFTKYNVCLFNGAKYITYWGKCMNHRHYENMDKHWSRLQAHTKLFIQ
jgi:hypothetical protein